MSYELNEKLVTDILGLVDHGLVNGLGKPEPGKMCIEACVCYAMGLPHSDEPTCVGKAVRSFKIKLNDCAWSSKEARAKGMRKIAIAQLGSDEIDQQAFAKLVAEGAIRRIVPIALRAAASVNPKFADELEAAAVRCEQEGTKEASSDARGVARKAYAADAYAYAAAYAAAAADAAADADAAYAAAYAAADADAAYAAAYAAYAAYAAAYAAYAAAAKRAERQDEILTIAADIGLQALIELKSPGCNYLHLTN